MNSYDDVRAIGAINFDSPVADYLQAALLPNVGSGAVVKELVSGVEYTLAAMPTWNGDGSVTNPPKRAEVGSLIIYDDNHPQGEPIFTTKTAYQLLFEFTQS